MQKIMGVLLGVFLIGAVARPASAQTTKVEVSGGYQYLAAKASGDDDFETFPAGWYADVAYKATPMFAVVGNVGGNYKTLEDEGDVKFKLHNFMGGVRVNMASRISPFGQVLVGGVNLKATGTEGIVSVSLSETYLGLMLGGGVTVNASDNVGVRLGADYLRINGKDDSELLDSALNGFRFVAGLAFGF